MIIYKNNKLAYRIIENQLYIVNPATSYLHCLNNTGANIWGLISDRISFEKLLEKMYSKYDVKYEILKKDLKSFIFQLARKGLVQIKKDE